MRHNTQPISEEEFLACYDDFADAIYRHCFFRVFSKPRAEELVQEAFMRTWEYLSSGKKVDNLRAFVYRVANNLIIDGSRKKKEEHLEEVLEAHPEKEPVSESIQEAIEQNALMREVMSALADLPDDERRIITYRYIDELGPREIANIMEITPNHVSVRLNRAIKSLRERMGE